ADSHQRDYALAA
ncbi:tmRNA tag peptide, partial [Mycobacterium tuberculosis NCGM2209]